jgi:hypothetical protein
MTLLDTLRDRVRTASAPATAAPATPRSITRAGRPPAGSPSSRDRDPEPAPWWQAPASGALAAATSWLVLALPALTVWVATAHTTVGWLQTLGVAGAGWFLGHGAAVRVDAATLTLAPLGITLLALAVTVRAVRRLLDRTERSAAGTTWPRLLVRRIVPGFVGGYAAFALLVGLLTLAGPARPQPWTIPVVLVVPVLSVAWVLLGRHVDEEAAGPVDRWLDRLPHWLPRALRTGIAGVGLLVGLGALLVVGMVVARWSTVAGLQAAVAADAVGVVVLAAGQLTVLPNLAVWALAFLAGPGFQIADGSSIALAGSHPGLMPMIPVLGALPADGVWSPWLRLALAAPTLVGVLLGWLVCRRLARLSSWRTKLFAVATAALTSSLAVTLLALLGSGSVGVDRLRSVGAQPALLGPALLGELLVGGAAYVLVAQLRLRFRHR